MSCCETIAGGIASGGPQSWAQTLVVGNISGGRDPTISNGDQIRWIDAVSVTKGEFDSRRITTAGAAATTAWNYTLADNSSVFVTAVVNAMQSDGSNRKYFEMSIGVFRDGGIATVQGVVFDRFVPYGSVAFAAALATMDVDGVNDVRVRVTGIAVTDIVWTTQIYLSESR